MVVDSKIPNGLSDLFFNHNLEEAEIKEDGYYMGFDKEKLLEIAEAFLQSMNDISEISKKVSAEDLVEDFLGRL